MLYFPYDTSIRILTIFTEVRSSTSFSNSNNYSFGIEFPCICSLCIALSLSIRVSPLKVIVETIQKSNNFNSALDVCYLHVSVKTNLFIFYTYLLNKISSNKLRTINSKCIGLIKNYTPP